MDFDSLSFWVLHFIEQYTIVKVEKHKHLTPKFTEYELIYKLVYRFHSNIQLAVYTQGTKSIDEFLKLITQSENITLGENKKYTMLNHKTIDRSITKWVINHKRSKHMKKLTIVIDAWKLHQVYNSVDSRNRGARKE